MTSKTENNKIASNRTNLPRTITNHPRTIEGEFRVSDMAGPVVDRTRYAAPLTYSTAGPKGEYSGYCCARCHCPQVIGAIHCPGCSALFPDYTQRHPAQPASPNPPGYKWSARAGRFISQERADRDANSLMVFFGILFGALLLLCLLIVH